MRGFLVPYIHVIHIFYQALYLQLMMDVGHPKHVSQSYYVYAWNSFTGLFFNITT